MSVPIFYAISLSTCFKHSSNPDHHDLKLPGKMSSFRENLNNIKAEGEYIWDECELELWFEF